MSYYIITELAMLGLMINDNKYKVTIGVASLRSPELPNELGAIVPRLFNLETNTEPEKPVKINLNLYQMEQDLDQSKKIVVKILESKAR